MGISEYFRAALAHKLAEAPRGTQARAADLLGVTRGRMNDYVHGRVTIPEDKREKLSKYLGATYEDMLRLGRYLLDGQEEEPAQPPWPHKDEAAAKAAGMNIIDYAYWIFDRAIERYPHTEIFLSHPRKAMVGHEKPIQRRLDGITNDAECYWECVDWIKMILDIDMKNAMSGRP